MEQSHDILKAISSLQYDRVIGRQVQRLGTLMVEE